MLSPRAVITKTHVDLCTWVTRIHAMLVVGQQQVRRSGRRRAGGRWPSAFAIPHPEFGTCHVAPAMAISVCDRTVAPNRLRNGVAGQPSDCRLPRFRVVAPARVGAGRAGIRRYGRRIQARRFAGVHDTAAGARADLCGQAAAEAGVDGELHAIPVAIAFRARFALAHQKRKRRDRVCRRRRRVDRNRVTAATSQPIIERRRECTSRDRRAPAQHAGGVLSGSPWGSNETYT